MDNEAGEINTAYYTTAKLEAVLPYNEHTLSHFLLLITRNSKLGELETLSFIISFIMHLYARARAHTIMCNLLSGRQDYEDRAK